MVAVGAMKKEFFLRLHCKQKAIWIFPSPFLKQPVRIRLFFVAELSNHKSPIEFASGNWTPISRISPPLIPFTRPKLFPPPVAGDFTSNRRASQASVAGPLKIAQRFNAGFIVRHPLKSRRDERTVCRPLRDFLPGIIRHTQP